MAKAKLGNLIQSISGNLAGSTFAHTRGGSVIRARPHQPTNPSAAQAIQRGFFGACRVAWHTLTPAEVGLWQSYPYPADATRWQKFLAYNLDRLRAGQSIATTPSTITTPPSGRVTMTAGGFFQTAGALVTVPSTFTFELWRYVQNASANPFGYRFTGTGVGFYATDAGLTYTRTAAGAMTQIGLAVLLTARAWNHFALTQTTTAAKVWVNGINVGTLAAALPSTTGAATLYIGNYRTGIVTNAGGYALARLSNVVRYAGTFTPPTDYTKDANTMNLWRFADDANIGSADEAGSSPLVVSGTPAPIIAPLT